ncbi:MAG: phage portal protein [Gemmatimonadales bacterium]|nr:phage portal protein [Gemmatimonadales bacterium]
MRWPWQKKTESRQSDGAYQEAVLRAIEAEAAGTASDDGATAGVECSAGLLARQLSGATVEGSDMARAIVTRAVLAQIGRDLIRRGESLFAIRGAGMLVPCADWHWEGTHDPATWRVRATAYGPSGSTTWNLPAASVVFFRWGGDPGSPYLGKGPLRYASITAKLAGQTERSLADESAGPLAQLLAVPGDPGDGSEDDPLAPLKAAIAGARGKAMLVETTAAGYDQGRDAAPKRDWQASRLGPAPPAGLVELRRDAFKATLAACGASIALFDDSDGTSKREALRQYHLNTVRPVAAWIEDELTAKLGGPVRLKFDSYALDMVSRAQVVDKLTRAGVALPVALAAVGLADDAD